MIEIMKIEHIAIYTHDLNRARDFYCTYFGFTAGERYRNPRTQFESYFLSSGQGVRLELMWRPGLGTIAVNDGELCGLSHIAFSIGVEADVDNLYARLVAGGFKPVSAPRKTGDGYYEACIEDPDGNRLELTKSVTIDRVVSNNELAEYSSFEGVAEDDYV